MTKETNVVLGQLMNIRDSVENIRKLAEASDTMGFSYLAECLKNECNTIINNTDNVDDWIERSSPPIMSQ